MEICPLHLPGTSRQWVRTMLDKFLNIQVFLFLLLIWFHGSCLVDIVTSVNLSDKAQGLTRPSVSYPSFLKSSFLGINPEDVNVEIILCNLLLKGSLSEIWTIQSHCVNLPAGKWKWFSRVESIDWSNLSSVFQCFEFMFPPCIELRFFNTVRLCNCFIIFLFYIVI